MSTQLNNKTYSDLIQKDIDWLINCTERSLERDHIIQILREHERDILSNG